MDTINPYKPQTAKISDKSADYRDVHADRCRITSINMQLNRKIVGVGTAITDDIPFKAKRSESTKIVQSSLFLGMCGDTQAKKQTKIFSKVKSAKDNITKLFKTTGRVSPAIPNLDSFAISPVRQYAARDVHPSPSPSLTTVSPRAVPRIHVVTVLDSLPSGKTRLEAVTSLVVEEHMDGFLSILRCVAGAPSPSSPAHLLTVPESQRTLPSTFLFNELHTIEEEVENPEVDAGGMDMEPRKLTASSPCGPLTASGSEAKYDAMLAAEFATFSFDSNDIQEWSDEVEREKQAKMDAHFAYVSKALAVPVPMLSAHFATDSPADFTTVEKDEFISDPSPVKTETTEANTSSADSSLVTSVDAEEDRLQLSPIILRGLRRVKRYEDLRNLQVITECSDSFSNLSCCSFDLGPPDSTAAGNKTGVLRRSVKCNDLRKSFLSLESGICHTPSCERRASMNQLSSIRCLGDSMLPALGLTPHPRGVHFLV